MNVTIEQEGPPITWGDTLARRTLRAAIDRLIPPDDFPGAWEAGVGEYIRRQLAGDLRHLDLILREGLIALDQEARLLDGQPFAALGPEEQDAVLERVEQGELETRAVWTVAPREFFVLLVALTNEGYYGDPGNGGNRDEVAWRMVGYTTRLPEGGRS